MDKLIRWGFINIWIAILLSACEQRKHTGQQPGRNLFFTRVHCWVLL